MFHIIILGTNPAIFTNKDNQAQPRTETDSRVLVGHIDSGKGDSARVGQGGCARGRGRDRSVGGGGQKLSARGRNDSGSAVYGVQVGSVGDSARALTFPVATTGSRFLTDLEDRKKEREEARFKREEKERLAEERRFRHETNQSLMQIALVKAVTGFFLILLRLVLNG